MTSLTDTLITNNTHLISESQFLYCYNKMTEYDNGRPLSDDEITDISKEIGNTDEFDRSAGSAWFILNRLHVLVHGEAAYGITENRAYTLFNSEGGPAYNFVDLLGYDVDGNIEVAKENMRVRMIEKARLDELKKNANKISIAYYLPLKPSLSNATIKTLRDNKENIERMIGEGVPVNEVYGQFI